MSLKPSGYGSEFLSTPSGWRATLQAPVSLLPSSIFLSTPSGWRATHKDNPEKYQYDISIHALRVEGDTYLGISNTSLQKFLSTPSGWRATGILLARII